MLTWLPHGGRPIKGAWPADAAAIPRPIPSRSGLKRASCVSSAGHTDPDTIGSAALSQVPVPLLNSSCTSLPPPASTSARHYGRGQFHGVDLGNMVGANAGPGHIDTLPLRAVSTVDEGLELGNGVRLLGNGVEPSQQYGRQSLGKEDGPAGLFSGKGAQQARASASARFGSYGVAKAARQCTTAEQLCDLVGTMQGITPADALLFLEALPPLLPPQHSRRSVGSTGSSLQQQSGMVDSMRPRAGAAAVHAGGAKAADTAGQSVSGTDTVALHTAGNEANALHLVVTRLLQIVRKGVRDLSCQELARLSACLPRLRVSPPPTFLDSLVKAATPKHQRRCSQAEAAVLLGALHTLRHRSPVVLRLLDTLPRLLGSLCELAPSEAVAAIRAVQWLVGGVPEPGTPVSSWWACTCWSLSHRVHQLDSHPLASLLHAAADWTPLPSSTVTLFLRAVPVLCGMLDRDDIPVGRLCIALHAFAGSNMYHTSLWQCACRYLLRVKSWSDVSARDVSDLVWVMGRSRHWDPAVMAQLSKAAAGKLDVMSPQQLSLVCWSLAKLRYPHNRTFVVQLQQTILTSLQADSALQVLGGGGQRRQGSPGCSLQGCWKVRDISQVVWSLAVLGTLSPSAFQKLLTQLELRLQAQGLRGSMLNTSPAFSPTYAISQPRPSSLHASHDLSQLTNHLPDLLQLFDQSDKRHANQDRVEQMNTQLGNSECTTPKPYTPMVSATSPVMQKTSAAQGKVLSRAKGLDEKSLRNSELVSASTPSPLNECSQRLSTSVRDLSSSDSGLHSEVSECYSHVGIVGTQVTGLMLQAWDTSVIDQHESHTLHVDRHDAMLQHEMLQLRVDELGISPRPAMVGSIGSCLSCNGITKLSSSRSQELSIDSTYSQHAKAQHPLGQHGLCQTPYIQPPSLHAVNGHHQSELSHHEGIETWDHPAAWTAALSDSDSRSKLNTLLSKPSGVHPMEPELSSIPHADSALNHLNGLASHVAIHDLDGDKVSDNNDTNNFLPLTSLKTCSAPSSSHSHRASVPPARISDINPLSLPTGKTNSTLLLPAAAAARPDAKLAMGPSNGTLNKQNQFTTSSQCPSSSILSPPPASLLRDRSQLGPISSLPTHLRETCPHFPSQTLPRHLPQVQSPQQGLSCPPSLLSLADSQQPYPASLLSPVDSRRPYPAPLLSVVDHRQLFQASLIVQVGQQLRQQRRASRSHVDTCKPMPVQHAQHSMTCTASPARLHGEPMMSAAPDPSQSNKASTLRKPLTSALTSQHSNVKSYGQSVVQQSGQDSTKYCNCYNSNNSSQSPSQKHGQQDGQRPGQTPSHSWSKPQPSDEEASCRVATQSSQPLSGAARASFPQLGAVSATYGISLLPRQGSDLGALLQGMGPGMAEWSFFHWRAAQFGRPSHRPPPVLQEVCHVLQLAGVQFQRRVASRSGLLCVELVVSTPGCVDVAVLADGPTQYSRNKPYRVMGDAVWNRRLLQAEGYSLLLVPFYMWRLLGSFEKKQQWLLQELRQLQEG